MKKLISILVAAVFAVSSGVALAASHAGAQPMEKKEEMKKDAKKSEKKAAPKKAASKKAAPKKAAKKDEMKK
jgi:adenylate kinase